MKVIDMQESRAVAMVGPLVFTRTSVFYLEFRHDP